MIIKFSLKLVIQQSLPNCKRRLRELAGLLDICDYGLLLRHVKPKKLLTGLVLGQM
jgi:hypothetical protein